MEESGLREARTRNAKAMYDSGHLMCRVSMWGVAAFMACAYFTAISFERVSQEDFYWPHDGWTTATYLVWIVLLMALTVDTRCWREGLFFGVLVVNFAVGCGLTIWKTAPAAEVRGARIATGVLWGIAAVLSMLTVGREKAVGQR